MKTAKDIIKESSGFLNLNLSKENQKSLENKIKEYAAQFIDLAAEEVCTISCRCQHPSYCTGECREIDKETILNIKEQII